MAHDVLWLQISMRHIIGVAVIDSQEKAFHYLSNLLLTETVFGRNYFVKKINTPTILHHKINVFWRFVRFIVLWNVRVVQFWKDWDLRFNIFQFLSRPFFLVDQLYGALVVRISVAGPKKYFSESPSSKRLRTYVILFWDAFVAPRFKILFKRLGLGLW